MSPRILSSRQFRGTITCAVQSYVLQTLAVGRGVCDTKACPAGLTLPGSSTPGAEVVPAGKFGTPGPPEPAGQFARSLKSPFRSCADGTKSWRTAPRLSTFHSSDQKKKTLSFTIGPPRVYP